MPAFRSTGSATSGDPIRLLVIDDDADFLRLLVRQLEIRGHVVHGALSLDAGLALLASDPVDGVILDHGLPGHTSGESLLALRNADPTITIVVLSGDIDVAAVAAAVRLGAEDVQMKPPNLELLQAALERGLERTSLLRARRAMTPLLVDPFGVFDNSAVMQRALRQVERCAMHDLPLLLVGEPGTGRRTLAEIAHQLSRRSAEPLVTINMANRPADQLDEALRGLREGSTRRAVLLQDFSLVGTAQQRLLLDIVSHRTAGAPTYRVVVTTGRDLGADVQQGLLMAGLFQQLATIPVHVPALRERGHEAIAALAERTRQRLWIELGNGPEGFTETATSLIGSLSWPGNVPQLRAVVEDAFARATDAAAIDVPHMTAALTAHGLTATSGNAAPQDWTLREAERRHVAAVLAVTGHNRAQAARLLGITRTTLYKKIAEFGLGDPE